MKKTTKAKTMVKTVKQQSSDMISEGSPVKPLKPVSYWNYCLLRMKLIKDKVVAILTKSV